MEQTKLSRGQVIPDIVYSQSQSKRQFRKKKNLDLPPHWTEQTSASPNHSRFGVWSITIQTPVQKNIWRFKKIKKSLNGTKFRVAHSRLNWRAIKLIKLTTGLSPSLSSRRLHSYPGQATPVNKAASYLPLTSNTLLAAWGSPRVPLQFNDTFISYFPPCSFEAFHAPFNQ